MRGIGGAIKSDAVGVLSLGRSALPALAGLLLLAVLSALTIGPGCAPVAYPYFVADEGCNCTEYRRRDGPVEYLFHARYRMSGGIETTLGITFFNRSDDTLSLDLGTVKISSRNVSYQYNDKFIPLPGLHIGPHGIDSLLLAGKDVTGNDDWHVIAGERLTLTIRGMRLGGRTLKEQQVTFVPENPKLRIEKPDE